MTQKMKEEKKNLRAQLDERLQAQGRHKQKM